MSSFIDLGTNKFMVNMKKKKLLRKHSLKSFLTQNFGVGLGTCDVLSRLMGLNSRFPKSRLMKKHVLIIKKKARKMYIGSKMKKILRERIINHIKLKNYIGIRHKLKLPAHGQRTRTNAKTKKKFRY